MPFSPRRPGNRGFEEPEPPPGYPRSSQHPVDPDSLRFMLPPGQELQIPPLSNPEDLGRHNMHLYSPMGNLYFGEGYNRDRSWATGIQGVDMPLAPGINPFAGPPAQPLYGPQMAPDTSAARREVRVMNSLYTANARNLDTQQEVDATNQALQRTRSPSGLDNFMQWLQNALTIQGGGRSNQNYLDSALK